MWRRLPLFARILVFFFANLIVVGLVVLGALRLRFALGPDPMVSLAHQLAFELESVSPTRWDAALAKRSRVAGVTPCHSSSTRVASSAMGRVRGRRT